MNKIKCDNFEKLDVISERFFFIWPDIINFYFLAVQMLLKYVCDRFCQNTDFLDTVVSLLIGDAFSVRELIEEETHNK